MKALAAIGLAGLALWGALSWLREVPRTREEPLEPREARAGSHELDVDSASVLTTPAQLPELASAAPAPASTREAATPPRAARVPIQMVLGRVWFPAGTPADERAFVIAHAWTDTQPSDHKVAVALDGTFRLDLPADARNAKLELEARYLVLEPRVDWHRGDTETVVLLPQLNRWIAGNVTDDRGVPLESFTLEASGTRSAPWHVSNTPSRTFEHAGGAFQMAGLAPGTWDLVVQSPGHLPRTTRIELPVADPIQIVLPRSAVVRGIVVSPHGVPLPRAHVEIRSDGTSPPQGQADSQGRFEIDGLAAGRATLRARSHRYAPSEPVTVELVAGSSVEDLRLELRQGGSALLRVVQRAEPVEAVLTITDANSALQPSFAVGKGTYRFGPAVPGIYTVHARRSDQTLERRFAIVPGAPEQAIELAFD
ncbi:MAG TPA: carboxypeptidase-like regulatory domain-containing protein [Planctomycetota bacterium]